MNSVRDTFCGYCGAPFEPPLVYPRRCKACSTEIWANPIPVSVVIVPIARDARTGVLVIRRGIEPGKGKLALVGGFVEEHETWAEGGAREVREETQVTVDPTTLEPLWFTSTAPRPNRVLLFSIASPIEASAVSAFVANHETLERGLVFGPDGLEDLFAFPLHVEAARRYFGSRSMLGPADYATI